MAGDKKSRLWVALAGLAGLAGMAGETAWTTSVVHRASLDMLLNASQANPYTNVHDGVWSYLRTSDNTLAGARTALANPHIRTPLRGLGSGLVSASDTGPGWILVNARGTNTVNGSISALPLPGGALLMHPGKDHRTVLRFTAPRAGLYAAEGYINGAVAGYNGKVVGTVLVNGTSVWEETITRTVANADRSHEKAAFATADQDLQAGDTLELVIGNADGYSSDCTEVLFDVTEKACPVRFIDPVTAIAARCATGVPAQPFLGSTGERWSLLSTTNPLASARMVLTSYVSDPDLYTGTAAAFCGASTADNNLGGPYCRIQAQTGALLAQHTDGQRDAAVAPCELWMHTGSLPNPVFASVLRFQPGAAGVYAFNVNVRDVHSSGNGVTLYVRTLDRILASATVNVNATAAAQIRIDPLFLVGTEPVEFIVDPCGNINGDGTALTLAVKKISEGVPTTWRDFNADVFANVSGAAGTRVNPVVTSRGDSWGFGQFTGLAGTYSKLPTVSTWTIGTYGEAGWTTTGEPFIFQTIAQNATKPYVSNLAANQSRVLYALPGEINLRGSTTARASVHYTAESDGVYAVKAFLRHLYSGQAGSFAAVRAAGGNYVAGTARIYHASTGFEDALMTPDDIYLRAGEALDLAVWSATGHNDSSGDDVTGLFAAVKRDDVGAARILSLDFNGQAAGESAVTFTGTGRLGFADAQRWDALTVVAGSASAHSAALRFADGTRSNVRATLTSAAGTLAASAADVAQHALLGDGVVSSGTDDTVTLSLRGLAPGGAYELVLYGDGAHAGVYGLGTASASSTQPCFTPTGKDVARLAGTADATGRLDVTFAAGAAGTATRFAGFQLRGVDFPAYVSQGTAVLIR